MANCQQQASTFYRGVSHCHAHAFAVWHQAALYPLVSASPRAVQTLARLLSAFHLRVRASECRWRMSPASPLLFNPRGRRGSHRARQLLLSAGCTLPPPTEHCCTTIGWRWWKSCINVQKTIMLKAGMGKKMSHEPNAASHFYQDFCSFRV